MIDDSSEDQVVALLKEKCFRELGIDIFSGTVSEECEMVQSCDSIILCGYATERSRKENGHYIKCITKGILKRARKWMIKRYKDQYDRLHDV